MRHGQISPRAQALARELSGTVYEFRSETAAQQVIYAQELDAVKDLGNNRAGRLLELRQGLPPILWIALGGLAASMLLFACLVGLEDTRLHMLGVSVLAAGIALVLFTIADASGESRGPQSALRPPALESCSSSPRRLS